jgi:hypothetical protein
MECNFAIHLNVLREIMKTEKQVHWSHLYGITANVSVIDLTKRIWQFLQTAT